MKTGRNGVIEVSRFVFSLFILFYHNLFLVKIPFFNNANYFVDFFFLLMGFGLLKVFSKYEKASLIGSTIKMICSRLKYIGIPVLIAYMFNLANCFLDYPFAIRVHYLWFIHIMIIIYLLFFVLYRIIKRRQKIFLIIMFFIFLITFIMRNIHTFYYIDELRGLSMISLGVLLSKLFSIRIINGKKKFDIIFLVFLSFLILLSVYVSSLSINYKRAVEVICDLLIFPIFICTCFKINFKSKVADILGLSSAFIYIYQPVCLLLNRFDFTRTYISFFVLVVLVVATVVILELRKSFIVKKYKVSYQTT